jgi:hypothetical protein
MDRVNSMVMVEKLKRTLAEELKRTLTQQQIKSKKKSTSVGTKNQVESFLVILNSGYNANLCHNIIPSENLYEKLTTLSYKFCGYYIVIDM